MGVGGDGGGGGGGLRGGGEVAEQRPKYLILSLVWKCVSAVSPGCSGFS